MCCFILPISPGQRVATHPSVTIAPVGVRRTTGARLRLRGTTRTRQAGRKRSLGAKPTSDSAAAPGAAGVRPHAPPPETEAPARPSPPTPDRTIPGESSSTLTFCSHSLYLTLTSCTLLSPAERETARTAPTPTAEPAAAHAATRPFANEEETRPALWRLAGSPGNMLKTSV